MECSCEHQRAGHPGMRSGRLAEAAARITVGGQRWLVDAGREGPWRRIGAHHQPSFGHQARVGGWWGESRAGSTVAAHPAGTSAPVLRGAARRPASGGGCALLQGVGDGLLQRHRTPLGPRRRERRRVELCAHGRHVALIGGAVGRLQPERAAPRAAPRRPRPAALPAPAAPLPRPRRPFPRGTLPYLAYVPGRSLKFGRICS